MPEISKNPQESVAQEIRELERMLEEKKRVLAVEGKEGEHKELFREAFQEKYSETLRSVLPPVKPPQAQSGTSQTGDQTVNASDREEQLQSLIELAFQKGIVEAVAFAQKTSPWLLDALHDRLIDEYYEKLIQAHRISDSP